MVFETIERSASCRGKTILVVEDEVLVRLNISDHLRTRGYHVIEANSAGRAIQVLKNDSGVDAVFTDIRMPGTVDGVDLANYVQTHFPQVAVLITTGHALTKELPKFFGGLISKPYRPAQVVKAIEDRLRNRAMPEANS